MSTSERPVSPPRSRHSPRESRSPRARLRGRWPALVAFSLFIAATAALIEVNGVFLSRDWLFVWVLVGLLALSITDLRRWARGLIFDWLPFAAVLVLYDLSHFFSQQLGTTAHVAPQIHADRLLFGNPIPTVRLQAALNTPGQLQWFDYLAWAVYMTHFFSTIVVAAALWHFAYERFREFRRMVVTLASFGFVTYVLFPAVPPWMASAMHQLEPTRRIVNEDVWRDLGINVANSLVENHSGFFNQVAAVPSLHAAYPLLFLLFFWAGARWWWRVALAVFAAAMAFTLVYAAEHYVFDILLGWSYAVAAFALVKAWDRRRAAVAVRAHPERAGPAPAAAPAPLTAAVERE